MPTVPIVSTVDRPPAWGDEARRAAARAHYDKLRAEGREAPGDGRALGMEVVMATNVIEGR